MKEGRGVTIVVHADGDLGSKQYRLPLWALAVLLWTLAAPPEPFKTQFTAPASNPGFINVVTVLTCSVPAECAGVAKAGAGLI